MDQAVVAHNGVGTQATPVAGEDLRIFRNLTRSLASDALAALNELEMWCTDARQLEQCHLVRHYLDYLRRLCDGKV